MATVSITPFPGMGSDTDTSNYAAGQSTMTVPAASPCGCGGDMPAISEMDITNALRRARTIQVLTIIFWVLLIVLLVRALFK